MDIAIRPLLLAASTCSEGTSWISPSGNDYSPGEELVFERVGSRVRDLVRVSALLADPVSENKQSPLITGAIKVTMRLRLSWVSQLAWFRHDDQQQ